MLNLLPTESVTLVSIVKGLPDDFGEVQTTEVDQLVEGCLIQPGSSVELPIGMELNQTNTITVHIPSTFTEDMTAGYAVVRGVRYRVAVATVPVTSSPLPWDRQVICEVAV